MPIMTEASDSGTRSDPAIPLGTRPCAHRMRVVGSVRPSASTRLDCDHPLRAVCVSGCEKVDFWRCESYACQHCSEVKKRRLIRLIEDGAGHQDAAGLRAYFMTVTAPGTDDHARWYQGKRPRHRQVCGCHRHGQTQARWNSQESACWNRLRTSITRTARVQFVGAVEPQERGALHRHVLMFTDEQLDYSEVQEQALAAGYGCVVDLQPLTSRKQIARYLAKYVGKSANGRAMVPWSRIEIDTDTGEISEVSHRPTYRLWSSSRHWGVTMKQIKAAQGEQARQRAMYLRELADLIADDSRPAAGTSSGCQGLDPP